LTILTTVTLASTDKGLPEDDLTVTKHVGAVLMSISIYCLRQSLVYQLVNEKIDNVKMHGMNVKKKLSNVSNLTGLSATCEKYI